MSDTETAKPTNDSAQATKVVTALVPRDQARPINTSTVVQHLGWRVSSMRATQSIQETLAIEFEKFQLGDSRPLATATENPADELDLASIFEQVEELVRADQRYDSESMQARRALATVLHRAYGEQMTVTGWVPGEMVKVKPWITEPSPERRFELTGEKCPKCEVNPERYGDGGGVACINEEECRWWYCA